MAHMRRCSGSAKFGIASHEAAIEDFPVQPSQPDGLGRMCRPHWTEYTRALRKAAGGKAAQADEFQAAVDQASRIVQRDARRAEAARGKPEPIRTKPARGRTTEDRLVVDAVTEASIA